MKRTLSIGKQRGLQQCTTEQGAFAFFALDHRNNLRKALHPEAPEKTTAVEMIAFKQNVVLALAPVASAILLDPEVGAAQCIASNTLPGNTGLAVAVEATGYAGDSQARQSRILAGWNVEKIKRMGANAVKLLIYYHPDSPTAPDIEALVHQVAADCLQYDIPLILEPLSYSLEAGKKKLSSDQKRRVVIETARRLTVNGVDILKAEFPLDVTVDSDERIWADGCAELSEASLVPWILLSAGVNYETYLRQVVIACQCGASGVAVGRAVWKEAIHLKGQAQISFLQNQARERMSRLTALCDALARPWTAFYASPNVQEAWYVHY